MPTTRTTTTSRGEDSTALLERLQTDLEERLARLASEPEQWVEFLVQTAVFGARYSWRNQMLLLVQAEERGITPRYFLPVGNRARSSGWNGVGRTVRRGETAFKIWAPIRRRPTEEQATAAEAAGRRVVREPSGRPAVQIVGFAPSNTFELSQTEGAPFDPPTVLTRRRQRLSGTPQLLTGDDPTGVYDDLVALVRDAGYAYELTPPGTSWLGNANGITVNHPAVRVVQVRDDVDAAQRTKTTLHELAHIRCGHLDDDWSSANLHRGRLETEAESVAHVVLAALGLDTAAYTDAYVFGWADGDLDLVRDCADTVLRVAKDLLSDLDPGETPGETSAESDPIDEGRAAS